MAYGIKKVTITLMGTKRTQLVRQFFEPEKIFEIDDLKEAQQFCDKRNEYAKVNKHRFPYAERYYPIALTDALRHKELKS